MVWLKFLICAGIIFFAGMRLTRYADIIEEKTGLGKAWMGLVLRAFRTWR
jgi:cation:H+ antiporter